MPGCTRSARRAEPTLYLLKRVLRAVRPSRPAPEPAPEPATVRRYPKRCEPIGTDEYGDPIYSREDMGRLREILKEGIAVRREAEAQRLA